MSSKIVNDAIFGIITLKPHILAIVDVPEFQRLRNIWQLGLVPFVYPTADHSRFEHSIGTYWLASKIVTKLQKQLMDENSSVQISDGDVMCVEIAALCHDVGHGPFSHTWDKKVLPRFCATKSKTHEEQFCEMWSIVKKNEKVADVINKNSIDEKLIEDLIKGKGKEILQDIISNSESGMDVDKWDYLARDASYLGHSTSNYSADINRMIHFVRAIHDEADKTWRIAYRESEGLNLFRVYQLRHYMYQTAYQHRTVVIIEEMFLDGIQQCIQDKIFTGEEIGSAMWILENTDAIFWSNYHKINAFKRIMNRDLYKAIFEAVKYQIISREDIKKVTNDCLEIIRDDETNIGVVDCGFKFGNRDVNPMKNIPFYKKHEDKQIFRYTTETLPSNLVLNCDETRIMVFSRDKVEDTDSRITEIKNRLKIYFEKDKWTIQNIK